MPEWLFDFLSGPTIKIAAAIWNSSMKLIIKLVCSTPQKFSTGTCIRGQRGSDSLL